MGIDAEGRRSSAVGDAERIAPVATGSSATLKTVVAEARAEGSAIPGKRVVGTWWCGHPTIGTGHRPPSCQRLQQSLPDPGDAGHRH